MGILKPIDQSLVSYTPGTPEFEALVSDTLGDQGSDADGFKAAMDLVLGTMPATEAALSALDGLTDDIDVASAAFDALDLTDLTGAWDLAYPTVEAWHSDLVLRTIGAFTPPAINLPTAPPPTPVTCTPITQPAPTPTPSPTPIPVPIIPPFPSGPCPEGFTAAPDGGCAPTASQDPYVTAGLKILLATAALNLPAGVAIGSAAFGSSIGTMVFGSTAASIIGVIGSVAFGALLPLVILSWLGINPFSDQPSQDTWINMVSTEYKLFMAIADTWGPNPPVVEKLDITTDNHSGLAQMAITMSNMTPPQGTPNSDIWVTRAIIQAFTEAWNDQLAKKIYSVEQVAWTLGYLQANWYWYGKQP